MTESQQPRRWLEGADEWREVATKLAREGQTGLGAEQRARMWAQLATQVAVEEVPISEAKPTGVRGKSSLLKVGALLALMGAIGGFWALRGARDDGPVKLPEKAVESQLVIPSVPVPRVAPPAARIEQAVEEPAKAPGLKPSRITSTQLPRQEKRTEVASQTEVAADPAAELALLVRARRVLLATPLRTLELTEEHARAYPRGAFAEEREVLAIEAMVRSDQKSEAAERTRRFAQAFPRSTHIAHLEALVQ